VVATRADEEGGGEDQVVGSGAERADAVPELARGLAALEPDDLAEGSLLLPLGLSLWLRRAGAGLEEAPALLLGVRRAVLAASALDRSTEPVPLLAGEPRTVVLHLAVYLDGLITRAAASIGATRDEIVGRALPD